MIDERELVEAVRRLKAGDLVAFPTETVYGLGADARNPAAIAKIYALKRRPSGHPLIVHLASIDEVAGWAAHVPDAAVRLAERFWPGPLTLILPRAAGVADALTGGQSSIGLRVPSHPVAQGLLRAFGGAIAAPSANRYGRVSPTTAQHVRDEFDGDMPLLLDGGACSVGLESTIVSCLDGLLLVRPGGIPATALEAVVGPLRRAQPEEGPRAPGTTLSHYAPATPLRVLPPEIFAGAVGAETAVLGHGPRPARFAGPLWIDAGDEPLSYGHDLYANLRKLDRAGARSIIVAAPPVGTAWEAVRDRLARAAAACSAEEIA